MSGRGVFGFVPCGAIAMKEHDTVVLAVDLPQHQLRAGDVGTVVHVHRGGEAYEVEFAALDGETLAVVTVPAADARAVREREIVHARAFSGGRG